MIDENFMGIDDRILKVQIYKEKEIAKDRLYYIFSKDKEYITVSGAGSDPHDLKDIQWNSSEGAKGILKQMMKIESGYTADMGFIKIADYPNNLYAEMCRFQIIYKDGWRFNRSNLGDELGKMQSKKRVYVKASKRSKAHYRMQTVGREELDPDVTDIWKIPRDQFLRLISGNKLELREKYIDEHNLDPYSDDHPELKKIIDLMDEDQAEWNFPQPESFFHDVDRLEQAIFRKLGRHEHVPLVVLKDYPEAAYSYEIDISDEALEQEPPRGEITHLTEMTKDEYDSIIESAKKDYEQDPKKITDTMLNQYYPDELEDVKRAAKFRKKVFSKIPKSFQYGFTSETMNGQLHESLISYLSPSLDIPDDVKAGYPLYFKDVPFTYEPTDNKNTNDVINDILAEVRDTCGEHLVGITHIVDKIIGSSGDPVPINFIEMSLGEERLTKIAMDDVSKLIGKDLLNKINKCSSTKILYDKTMTRATGGEMIRLGRDDINVEKDGYYEEVITHEYGHSIEHMIPEISDAARSFRDRRTENEKMVRLVDIMPHIGYDEYEMTQVDHFMTAYIGKYYSKATEVLSTGMAFLTTKASTQRMYTEDPEYFGLILAMLSGKIKGENE